MMPSRIALPGNGQAIDARAVPRLPQEEFQQVLADAITAGARVSAYYGQPLPEERVLVTAVLANDAEARLGVLATVAHDALPSLAEECPSLQLFERELAEQFGVVPRGHPWLKPVRFEHPLGGVAGSAAERAAPLPLPTLPGDTPFFRVAGEEVHEVAVGPVHAGIIEPGHFRFQCHGEHVFHLEISLGYQHRAIERMLLGGPTRRTPALVETIAGDTAVGHGLASARAQEGLAGIEAPPRAAVLRAMALELERLANHVGDLGALAGDIGYLPTASYCGALRADYLNALAELCGNRFGRGLVVPGGVRFDLPADAALRLAERLSATFEKVEEAAGLFFRSPSVRNRTDGTGTLDLETAALVGVVGPAARASGLAVDVRRSHPFTPYDASRFEPVTAQTGDVFARAFVRLEEARVSARLVDGWLRSLPPGPVRVALPALAPDRLVVSLVEGWRGELCHVVTTGGDGRFARYKVVDASFHDWMGLQLALRGEQISDFPLCNKSFNLSYCGHDL
jgi:Ni,Fe-hydrogenase III large subunit